MNSLPTTPSEGLRYITCDTIVAYYNWGGKDVLGMTLQEFRARRMDAWGKWFRVPKHLMNDIPGKKKFNFRFHTNGYGVCIEGCRIRKDRVGKGKQLENSGDNIQAESLRDDTQSNEGSGVTKAQEGISVPRMTLSRELPAASGALPDSPIAMTGLRPTPFEVAPSTATETLQKRRRSQVVHGKPRNPLLPYDAYIAKKEQQAFEAKTEEQEKVRNLLDDPKCVKRAIDPGRKEFITCVGKGRGKEKDFVLQVSNEQYHTELSTFSRKNFMKRELKRAAY